MNHAWISLTTARRRPAAEMQRLQQNDHVPLEPAAEPVPPVEPAAEPVPPVEPAAEPAATTIIQEVIIDGVTFLLLPPM
jgi:hypothetical protein